MNADETKAVWEDAKKLYLATIFLMNADRHHTQDNYTCGHNNYPHTVLAAYEFFDGYTSMYSGPHLPRSNDGVSFHNSGESPAPAAGKQTSSAANATSLDTMRASVPPAATRRVTLDVSRRTPRRTPSRATPVAQVASWEETQVRGMTLSRSPH
jgi:hypothetical protein